MKKKVRYGITDIEAMPGLKDWLNTFEKANPETRITALLALFILGPVRVKKAKKGKL